MNSGKEVMLLGTQVSPLDAYKSFMLENADAGPSAIVRMLEETFDYSTTTESVRKRLRKWGVVPGQYVRAAKKEASPNSEHDENVELRAEVQRLKGQLGTAKKEAELEDRIELQIRQAIEKYPPRPILKPKNVKKISGNGQEFFLALSDAHFPEVVDPEESLGLVYNSDVVRRRMSYVRDQVLKYREIHASAYPIQKLTVGVLGDMLSGNIHEELEITNEFPIAEALPQMSYMLHDMFSDFREEIPEVEVVVMPGNHPRFIKKPRAKNKWDNYEYIMGKFVQGLAREDYKVVVPKSIIHIHEVFGRRLALYHGDGSKAQSFAGIPFYSLKTRTNAFQAMLSNLGQERVDMLIMGHFHQLLSWREGDCEIFVNGSIKGGDEYGIVSRHQAPEAVQALLTFDKKHGLVGVERINLSHIS